LPTFFTEGTGDKKPASDVTFAKDERRFFFGSYKSLKNGTEKHQNIINTIIS